MQPVDLHSLPRPSFHKLWELAECLLVPLGSNARLEESCPRPFAQRAVPN